MVQSVLKGLQMLKKIEGFKGAGILQDYKSLTMNRKIQASDSKNEYDFISNRNLQNPEYEMMPKDQKIN